MKTLAFFHSAGKTPVSIDLLKMLHSEPAMMGPAVFRSLTEILASPIAFLVKRDLRFQVYLSLRSFSIEMWCLFWTHNVHNHNRFLVEQMRVFVPISVKCLLN